MPIPFWKHSFCLITLLVLCIGTADAQRRRRKQPPLPPPPPKPMLLCRLATGGGYGKIPRFAAEFYNRPSKLVYTGHKHTPKLGKYGYILPDILLKNLLLDAKRIKLLSLPEPPMAPPDAPTDTLFIWVEGKTRTFRFSPVNAPEPLVKFTQKLREDITAILEEQEPAETPTDTTKLK